MLRLTLLCLSLVVCTAAQAASVVWSATINGIDLASGADAPTGSLVRLGTFDITDAEIASNASVGNIPFLNSHFTEYGSALIGDGARPAGHFSTITNNNGPTAIALAGAQIYVWAFSSGTVAGSTEHGIFYLPKATDADWQFPAQVPFPDTTQIGLDDLTDLATSTTLKANARVVVGSFGPGTSDSTGKPNFTLVPVPEPTSAALLVAVAGLVGFIRRRS